MEIGVSTASLFKRYDTLNSLKVLRDMDARVVEIFLESFSEYDASFISSLGSELGELTVHSLHTVTTQFEPQMFSDIPLQKKDAYRFMENICRGAKEIGAKNYTLHGRAKIKKNARFDDFPSYIKHFNDLTELCGKYGVNVCLENVEWAFFGEPQFFARIKDSCPSLRTCFDLKQARLSGFLAEDYLSVMAGTINTVHLSDIDENGKMCLPTFGTVDFYRLFELLKNTGFDGNMLIEVYPNDYRDESEIAESLYKLRKIKREVF